MDRFEHLKNMFKSGDEKLLTDFTQVREILPLSSKQQKISQSLLTDSFRFVRELRGENGSPTLVQTESGAKVVLKTYAPSVDVRSDTVIEHADRLGLLREEAAAFCVSVYFPLLQIPPTVLRPVSQDQMKAWNVPVTYDSDSRNATFVPEMVMVQQFAEGTKTYANIHMPLPEITHPRAVFGLLMYDYLVAYGDGRFANLLVDGSVLWGIDHGGSFRLKGTLRGTQSLGIGDQHKIGSEDASVLKRIIDPKQAKDAVIVLEKLLGKKKTIAFTERFATLHMFLRDKQSFTVGELKAALS